MLTTIKALASHQGFKKYFANTSWLLGERILRTVVGLFVGIWVARYLGPEQFGLLSYAQSFVGLFTALATLGLDGIVVRELVKNPKKREEILGTAFWLRLAGAFCVIAILAVAVNFMSNDAYTNTLIFIIASASIFQSFNVIDFYFQSVVLSKFAVYANSIALLVSSITKISLILAGAPLVAFAWVLVLDSLILSSGLAYFYFRNNRAFTISSLRFIPRTAVRLLKDSWPLMLSGVVVSLYMKIDQVMIKEMIGAEAVGQYAAAVRLSEAWYFIPMVIASSLFPAIINAKKENEKLYYARMQQLYNLMVTLALSIAIPTTLMGSWVITLLYGDGYDQSGSVLVIYIWAAVFVFLGVASGKWFVAEDLQKYLFYRTATGCTVNIFLNLLLISIYGIQGAAVATLVSQIVAAYIFDLIATKTKRTFYMKTKSLFFLRG